MVRSKTHRLAHTRIVLQAMREQKNCPQNTFCLEGKKVYDNGLMYLRFLLYYFIIKYLEPKLEFPRDILVHENGGGTEED